MIEIIALAVSGVMRGSGKPVLVVPRWRDLHRDMMEALVPRPITRKIDMTLGRLVNVSTGQTVCSSLEMALSPTHRAKGLLGRPTLAEDYGLWIDPCSSIHTFFMKFAIDVAFVSSQGKVVRIYQNVKPFRMALGGWSARAVIETAAGWLKEERVKVGDQLEVRGEDSLS